MVVVFAELLGMAKAGVETGVLEVVAILKPHIGVVIAVRIQCVEDGNPICEDSNMPKAHLFRCASVGLWVAAYLEHKVLITWNGRAAYPRAYAIAGNAGGTYIHVIAAVLYLLHIAFYASITGGPAGVQDPGGHLWTSLRAALQRNKAGT
jgi:hypothetical protein